MPTEITTIAYKFDELSDKAKEKVREWFSPDIDLSYVIDDFKVKGKALGYRVDDVQYRISYSQGDGASWTGLANIATFAARVPDSDPNYAAYMVLMEMMREGWVDDHATITRSSYFYNHSGTMGIDGVMTRATGFYDEQSAISDGILQGASVMELFENVMTEDFLEDVQVDILTEAKSLADDLYKDLVKAYEWEMSDEHIAECAEINEWLFDENGKII